VYRHYIISMPDWFYRTITRPLLFMLPPRHARASALGIIGTLGRLPGGGKLIDLLGHMLADARLSFQRHNINFPSPIGLGPNLDRELVATNALARFGVGWLNLGVLARDTNGTAEVIGVTQVFVEEDLSFMQTTAIFLRETDRRLVPLIAHDRATFGCMLLASGWVFLLPALWGFRRGRAWLWWLMLASGAASYMAGICIHYVVGYTHWTHLAPAFAGCALFMVGMVLCFPYLGIRHPENDERWHRRLAATSRQQDWN
jgi:hypothetical protein